MRKLSELSQSDKTTAITLELALAEIATANKEKVDTGLEIPTGICGSWQFVRNEAWWVAICEPAMGLPLSIFEGLASRSNRELEIVDKNMMSKTADQFKIHSQKALDFFSDTIKKKEFQPEPVQPTLSVFVDYFPDDGKTVKV